MFLSGLTFALGFIAGMSIFSGMFHLVLAGVDQLVGWQKRRWRRLCTSKVRTPQYVVPQIRERVVFCFRFRTDDWMRMRDETEYRR